MRRRLVTAIQLFLALLGTKPLPAQEAAWPTWHGDSTLRGHVAAMLPDSPVRAWQVRLDAPVVLPPVSDGKRVFCISERGKLVAVDFRGQELWSTTFTNRVSAPLLAVDGLTVLATESGMVCAFQAETGKTNWTYQAGDRIQGGVNFWADPTGRLAAIVIITQPSGILHAVDPQTGRKLWVSPETGRTDGSPAVGNDLVVFGNCGAAFQLVCTKTGRKLGEIPLGEGCEMAGGTVLAEGWAFAGNRSGSLVAADIKSGRPVWRFKGAEEELFTTPAVSNDRVILLAPNGTVYALKRKTGQKLWQFQTGATGDGAPAVAGDKVVIAAAGSLWLLRLSDGALVWKTRLSDRITSPAIARNLILVGTDEGYLVAFGSGEKHDR